jgi:hypothetical protein
MAVQSIQSANAVRRVVGIVVCLGAAALVGALPVMGVTGCSSEPSQAADAAGADGGQPLDSSLPTESGPADVGAPDAPGGCTAIPNTAPVVSKTSHPEPTPAMTGGAITDGRYHLTAMDKYNGKSGDNTHQETWVFTGGRLEVVSTQSDKPGVVRASGTYAVAGNVVTVAFACPSAITLKTTYTATATEIRTVNSDDPNEVHTLTRQP